MQIGRRNLLKALLLTPLAGLFKKKPTRGEMEAKHPLMTVETNGTSSQGSFFLWDENGCLVSCFYEKDYEIKAHRIADIPIGFWKVT